MSGRKYTHGDLTEWIRLARTHKGTQLKASDCSKTIPSNAILTRYFGSFNRAMRAAGVDYQPSSRERRGGGVRGRVRRPVVYAYSCDSCGGVVDSWMQYAWVGSRCGVGGCGGVLSKRVEVAAMESAGV